MDSLTAGWDRRRQGLDELEESDALGDLRPVRAQCRTRSQTSP